MLIIQILTNDDVQLQVAKIDLPPAAQEKEKGSHEEKPVSDCESYPVPSRKPS